MRQTPSPFHHQYLYLTPPDILTTTSPLLQPLIQRPKRFQNMFLCDLTFLPFYCGAFAATALFPYLQTIREWLAPSTKFRAEIEPTARAPPGF